ncbi:glycosyltransferase family A protein [Clostridium sp. DL1XJH146]
MNLQVLLSIMNRDDFTIVEKMNIQSKAIVINQCDKNQFEKLRYKGNSIEFISLAERGVGLSRNNALMRATEDICLFADDDIVYVDGYKDIVINAFQNNPKADFIVFNVPSKNPDDPSSIIKRKNRVRFFTCQRYGTFQMAVKTKKIREKNIYFSLLFGGGAKYSAGEDSIFITECIKKKLKVYAEPTIIGTVSQQESTWFKGYTDKFFLDRGALFHCLWKKWAWILCLQFAIRHRKMFRQDKGWVEAYLLMRKGTKLF